MQIQDLYGFVLVLVMIGMVLGVGVIVLDNFAATSGISTTAATAINNTRDAITPIASTWLPLIVTVAVLALILAFIVRSFVMKR